jgi:serine/threonine protein kinase
MASKITVRESDGRNFHFDLNRVMLSKNIQTGKLYAIKIISKDDATKVNLATFQRVLKNEVEILQRLNH